MRICILKRAGPAVLAIAAALAVAGCGSPRRGEPLAGRWMQNPEIEQGKMAFQHYCHSCHPGGEGGLGPALNDKPLPGFLVKRQVRWGLGVMPSFGEDKISAEELDLLVEYMAALRKSG